MEIILSKEAVKEYNRLPKSDQIKIFKKLSSLGQDPKAGKKLTGELCGIRSLRAWPYRILYEINSSSSSLQLSSEILNSKTFVCDANSSYLNINEKEKRVEILKIAHRQGVYK